LLDADGTMTAPLFGGLDGKPDGFHPSNLFRKPASLQLVWWRRSFIVAWEITLLVRPASVAPAVRFEASVTTSSPNPAFQPLEITLEQAMIADEVPILETRLTPSSVQRR